MKSFAVLAALAFLGLAHGIALERPPHVLLILADDLGWEDVGWHNKSVLTPNLEAMIADGILMDHYYVQPECTPSRFAIMTGLYPIRGGMQSGVVWPDHPECAPLDIDFAPVLLKELGYQSHMMGKWHLGFCAWECTPLYKGFDTFMGYYQGYSSHYDHMMNLGQLKGHDWKEGKEEDRDSDGIHSTDLIADRTIEYIDAWEEGDDPLYMYVTFGAPHAPLAAPEEYKAMYEHTTVDPNTRIVWAMVSHLDARINDIKEALENKGMMDDTIIVFMADNGGEWPDGYNGELRGAKTTYFEGGIRSASFVYSPNNFQKGITNEKIMHITDWLPTIISLAGGNPSDFRDFDGVDQSDMLINDADSARDGFLINYDDHFPQSYGDQGIRDGDFKLIRGYPGGVDGREGDICTGWATGCCRQDFIDEGRISDVSDPSPEFDETRKRSLPETRALSSNARDSRGYILTAAQLQQQSDCIADSANDLRLFNIRDDPYEYNNLAYDEDHHDIVQNLLDKLDEYAQELVPANPKSFVGSPEGSPDNWDGNWTPGWCDPADV